MFCTITHNSIPTKVAILGFRERKKFSVNGSRKEERKRRKEGIKQKVFWKMHFLT